MFVRLVVLRSGRSASSGALVGRFMELHGAYSRSGGKTKWTDKSPEKRRILVLFGEELEVKMVVKRYAFKKMCGNAEFL